MGRDGEELVTRLKQLLQLGDSRTQSCLIVRETALQARVPAQIQLPPKKEMANVLSRSAQAADLTQFLPQCDKRGGQADGRRIPRTLAVRGITINRLDSLSGRQNALGLCSVGRYCVHQRRAEAIVRLELELF